ncbi:DUF4256 domain-containing protein [Candidatus Peregrinibacteria bacterium]|nr:DUF4256 domain-containing protein [Candidatus Peregrinibacteria bacterium]
MVKTLGSSAGAPETRYELSPEQADALIRTLEGRFDAADEKLRKTIDFAAFEERLRENKEALFSIEQLEKTGGEPQMVGMEGGQFVVEDRSGESPSGRRNRNFDQADAQRKEFGPGVRFQSEKS